MTERNNLASPDALLAAAGFQLAEVEANPSIMYLLDSQLRIVYCNRAWNRFALANGGVKVLNEKVRGTRVLDVVPEPLTSFYEQGFRQAIQQQAPWEHDFECSSAELYRLFHMRVLPLAHDTLLVENSLRIERPHGSDRAVESAVEMLYRDENGLITMCMHCRRTKTVNGATRWHWVPLFVQSTPKCVSHGLCETCRSFYFR